MANRYDTLEMMKRSLGPKEFRAVLSYYGIREQRNSILCPFHNDRHYGSCKINKSGTGAKCYACGKRFSSIDLVMEYEGLAFADALEFLWTKILGNNLPGYDDKGTFNNREFQFLGLWGAMGRPAQCNLNMCQKADSLPDGFAKDFDSVDDEGCCVVYKFGRYGSLYNFIESDPEAAYSMIAGKARETINSCYRLLRTIQNPHTAAGLYFLEHGQEKDEVAASIRRDIEKAKLLKRVAISAKKKKAS